MGWNPAKIWLWISNINTIHGLVTIFIGTAGGYLAPMIFPVGGIISITLLSMMGVSFCALMAIFLILAAKYSYRKLCPVRVAISAHGGEEVSLLVRFSKGAAYTIWGHINDRNPFILWSREKVKTEEEVKILVADYTGDDFYSGSWGMRVYDHMHIPVLFEKGKTDWIQIKVRVARGGLRKRSEHFYQFRAKEPGKHEIEKKE